MAEENKNIKGKINELAIYHTDAYAIAVKNGFTGTVTEWLEYIRGKNAYEIAVAHGFDGTEEEWLAHLADEAVDHAKEEVDKYADEAAAEVQKSAQKAEEAAELAVLYNGKGAYGYAQDGGYTGTEEQFALKMSTETFVTPQMFGAKGDGVTDDTEKMAVAATEEKAVDLNGKSYVVSDTITLHTIFQNGTLIYKGDVNKPVVSLKDGGGLVGVNIIIAVENYASSVVLADYTTYTTQWTPMRWTIDGLHIDNTITTEYIEGSSCIKITYDKWKVVNGQNINDVTFDGYMDYGIHIEPQLRNTGSGNPKNDDNPTFNTAVFSNVRLTSCNTALKVYPKMLTGEAETALGSIGLMLFRFSNENDPKQEKPFLDLHNANITGDMVIPWDYYGERIPEQGTYRLHNSHVNVNTAYFMRSNHTDNVRYSWFYDDSNGEHYTNHYVIKPENIGDRLPFREGTTTPWSVDTIKAVRFKPEGNSYDYMGFEMTYGNNDEPDGRATVQFGFNSVNRMVWRYFDTSTGAWSPVQSIYADGANPVSYNGKRPDGLKPGDYRFDTSYAKPIFWDGTKWVFADGLGLSEGADKPLSTVATLIDTNSNLNDYITGGFFGVRGSDDAKTIANNPLADKETGFLLEVYNINGMMFQRICGLVNGGIYLRRYTSSGWSAWRHIPTEDEVQTMIDTKFNTIVNGNGVAY